MLMDRLIPTVLCSSLIALAACDKDESLGEVESETSAESETAGESASTDGETGETEGESDTDLNCPADAMICPDGTAVGRSGPDCAFDPCPGETDGETGDTDGEPICAPDDEYFEPAACPSEFGNGYVIDPDCQTQCLIENSICGDGSVCMPVEINPCVCDEGEDCCGACAAGMTLCVPVSSGEACEAIVGQSFSSIEQYECGLDPEGPVLCNWSLDFQANGQYLWLYSDIGEGGEYACKDGQISLANNQQLQISYAADSGVLTWDGIEYAAD